MKAEERDPATELLGCVGLLATLPLAVVWAAVVHGFVLFKLWGWFVVPLLNVPAIPLAGAAGLALLARYVVWTGSPTVKNDDGAMDVLKKLPAQYIGSAFAAGLTLLSGKLIQAVWL